MSNEGAPQAPGTVVLTLSGSVGRAGIAALCEQLRTSVAAAPDCSAVICDVGRLTSVDMAAVEALARLQLTARRLGHRMQLRHASAELIGLLALCGLSTVVPLEPAGSVEPQRQTEQGEQPRRIEEEGDAGDPAVS